MTEELIEINQDTIRELRASGNWIKADKMLKAFRDNCAHNKRLESNSINCKNRNIKKHFGICMDLHCDNERYKDHSRCEKHYLIHVKHLKKYRENKKNVINKVYK